MKPRQLVVYLVVFLLVGGFYLLYDVYLRGEQTKLEEAEAKILDIKAEEKGGKLFFYAERFYDSSY